MLKLTHKEKLVFYGLTRWPDLHDEELSKKIDVKRSTITAIRNKLNREKLYTKHHLPALGKIGCELLVARYGEFNPLTPWSQREKYASRELELFYRISTDTSRVSLVSAENFTEMKKYLETAARRHASHGFLASNGVTHVYFPFALSKLFLFYDFAPLLNKHFNLGFQEDNLIDTKFRKPETIKLSETEKLVLYAMVKYPQLHDKKIAEKLSLTRQTVNNTRHKIMVEELIKTVRFPDLERLGFELITFTHAELRPETPLEKRGDGVKKLIEEGSQYLIISGNMEAILLSAFKSYTDFERTYEKIIGYYTEKQFLEKEPHIKIYPIHEIRNHMKLRAPLLVKKILNIQKEV